MLTEAEIETVESRADVITYTVLAEMEHFQRNRVTDFEVYMQRYLHGQIAFYRQVQSTISVGFLPNRLHILPITAFIIESAVLFL